MKPIRLLHVLDGLLSLASLTSQGQGVVQRRQRQRLAMAQRLLEPLPRQLAPSNQSDLLFWRCLRWGTLGLVLAWLLKI